VARDPDDPWSLIQLGADVHRLRIALAAHQLASTVDHPDPGAAVIRVAAG
jgi:hypothetical protein